MKAEELAKLVRLMVLVAEGEVNDGPSHRPNWEIRRDIDSLLGELTPTPPQEEKGKV